MATNPHLSHRRAPLVSDADYLGIRPLFAVQNRRGKYIVDTEMAATFSTVPWQVVEQEILQSPKGNSYLDVIRPFAWAKLQNRPEYAHTPTFELPRYLENAVKAVREEAKFAMARHQSRTNHLREGRAYTEIQWWFRRRLFVVPPHFGPDPDPERTARYWGAEGVPDHAARPQVRQVALLRGFGPGSSVAPELAQDRDDGHAEGSAGVAMAPSTASRRNKFTEQRPRERAKFSSAQARRDFVGAHFDASLDLTSSGLSEDFRQQQAWDPDVTVMRLGGRLRTFSANCFALEPSESYARHLAGKIAGRLEPAESVAHWWSRMVTFVYAAFDLTLGDAPTPGPRGLGHIFLNVLEADPTDISAQIICGKIPLIEL